MHHDASWNEFAGIRQNGYFYDQRFLSKILASQITKDKEVKSLSKLFLNMYPIGRSKFLKINALTAVQVANRQFNLLHEIVFHWVGKSNIWVSSYFFLKSEIFSLVQFSDTNTNFQSEIIYRFSYQGRFDKTIKANKVYSGKLVWSFRSI